MATIPDNITGGGDRAEVVKVLKALVDSTGNVKRLLESQGEEIKKYGKSTEETAGSLREQITKAEELQTALAGVADKYKNLEADVLELKSKNGRPNSGAEFRSLGEQFIESVEYTEMIKSRKFEMPGFQIKDAPLQAYIQRAKAISLDPASAGTIPVPFRYPNIITPPHRTLRIRDLLTVASTSSSSIDYIQETAFTTEASPNTQKQGAAAPVAEGATKPEARLTFTKKSATVRTIAHWIAVTRQAIEDAAQLRAYVDGRLLYGVDYAEESQILYGSGTDPEIMGIVPTSGVQTYAASTVPADTKYDAIRRGFTKSQLSYYPVTGVVLNPNDWQDIELLKADDGHYLVTSMLNPLYSTDMVWRVPVVVTDAILAGRWLSGAFAIAAYLWDRQESNIRVSEHHASFFIQNMIAILAEERLALTVFRPDAFLYGTF